MTHRTSRELSSRTSTNICWNIELLSRLVQRTQFSVQVTIILMLVAKTRCVWSFMALRRSNCLQLCELNDWCTVSGNEFPRSMNCEGVLVQAVNQWRKKYVRLKFVLSVVYTSREGKKASQWTADWWFAVVHLSHSGETRKKRTVPCSSSHASSHWHHGVDV